MAKKPDGWKDWRKTRVANPKAGTRRKKVPMPKLPRNVGPVKGEGYAGRV